MKMIRQKLLRVLATPLGQSYNLNTFEDVEKLLSILDSGKYGCINEDGEEVVIFREIGEGIEMYTFQNNGWVRLNYFDEQGYDDGEDFCGRWNK